MNQRLSFGSVEVPDGWRDQTTYQFVSPPKESLGVPLAAGKQVKGGAVTANVAVSRLPLPTGVDLDTLVAQQRQGFVTLTPGAKLLSEEPWHHPELGAQRSFECSFEVRPGVPIHQAQVLILDEDHVVRLIFTSAAASFEDDRKNFQSVLDSLQLSTT